MSEDFFEEYGGSGGGMGAPSFKFNNVGDTIRGEIVSTAQRDQRTYDPSGPGEPIPNPHYPAKSKHEFKQELVVVLQTKLRNWEGAKGPKTDGIPRDADGNPLPPSEDTGARSIVVKGWMIGAITDAIRKATGDAKDGLKPGGKLAVQHTGTKKVGQGMAKLYAAKYEPPAAGSELFAEAEEAQEERVEKAKAAAVQTAPLSLDDEDDDDTPPF